MSYYVKLGDEWVAINGRIRGREQSCSYIRYCTGAFLRDWASLQRPQLALSSSGP